MLSNSQRSWKGNRKYLDAEREIISLLARARIRDKVISLPRLRESIVMSLVVSARSRIGRTRTTRLSTFPSNLSSTYKQRDVQVFVRQEYPAARFSNRTDSSKRKDGFIDLGKMDTRASRLLASVGNLAQGNKS